MKVNLTKEQLKKLSRLWFIYGNNGLKHTHYNHIFIQRFIDSNEDQRDELLESKKRRVGHDKIKHMITDECIAEVDKIIKEL